MARPDTAHLHSTRDTTAKLVLRVALGVLILFHGLSKLMGAGIGPIGDSLTKAGLPAALSYGVYAGEVLAPILLIVGAWTRPAALVVAINMVVAIALVHLPQLLSVAKTGGYALELQAMYLFSALAVALLGAGRFSLGGPQGRWN
jgi:putative oxidoreductase